MGGHIGCDMAAGHTEGRICKMEYRLAKRVRNAMPTMIRQVSEYASKNPDFISFHLGNPAYETFPVEQIREISDEVMRTEARSVLPYGPNPGWAILKEEIRRRLIHKGIDMTDQEVLITPGSGHGMDLMVNTFCEKGDVILTEKITYPGILGAARMSESRAVGVKTDGDGMEIEDLERKAGEHPEAKFIYLVPTFSNPTGVTVSAAKRRELYRVAAKYGLMIYEDDPYSELRFAGEPVPSIKSFDGDGRVVYAGSFSKILSAGMRVGYVVCHKELYPRLSASQGNWMIAASLCQFIVAYFMRDSDMDAHVRGISEFYGKKAELMKSCVDRYFPAFCKRSDPEGGLFLYVTLPRGIDMGKLWHELLQKGVGVVPAAGFAPDEDDAENGFRMCYSVASPEEIDRGCRMIGESLKSCAGRPRL